MKVQERLWAILLALVLCVPAAWAQQKDPRLNPPAKPLPPLAQGESSSKAAADASGAVQQDETAPPKQEQRPLSSVQELTPEVSSAVRNRALISFSIYQGGDTNPRSLREGAAVESVSTVNGHMALQRLWRHYELTAEYTGGGQFYSENTDLNASHHELGITQKYQGRRWTLTFADQMSYSPEAFGGGERFAGGGGAGLFGGGEESLVNLNPLLVPNQSILTARARRISNTVVGEVAYASSARSTWTASASYGILRFLDSGYFDSGNAIFQAGYNYVVTPKDSVALTYGASLIRFIGMDRNTDSHVVQIAYGRQITGRMTFQLAAGPQISMVGIPGAGTERLISWSLQSSLAYHFPKADVRLSYMRGVSGGSGVLLGAETHQVDASVTRQLTRLWDGSLNFGYARNTPLGGTAEPVVYRAFQSWQGGFSLGRTLGRYSTIHFRYQLHRQNADTPGCVGPACGTIGLRHVFGLTFNFNFRPIEFD